MELPQGLVLGRINPVSRRSSIKFFTSFNSAVDSFYIGRFTGFASATRLIFISTLGSGGNPLSRSSGNKSEYCPSNGCRVDEDGRIDAIELPRVQLISSLVACSSEPLVPT
jgi:hypothetical protein